MRDRIEAAKNAGVDVLSLRGASPYPPGENVLDAAAAAIWDSTNVGTMGRWDLRGAISEKLARENGIRVDPDSQVLVTNGGMHALTVAMYALLEPGDEGPYPLSVLLLRRYRISGGRSASAYPNVLEGSFRL